MIFAAQSSGCPASSVSSFMGECASRVENEGAVEGALV